MVGPDLDVIAAVTAIYVHQRHDPASLVQPVLAAANRISQAMAAGHEGPDPRTIDFNRRRAGLG